MFPPEWIAEWKQQPENERRWRTLAEEPVALEQFGVSTLQNCPVFAADDVAAYVESLPEGTDFADLVSSMAPPFKRFFVEFQGIPNSGRLHAWGCLVHATDDPNDIAQMDGDSDKPRWLLDIKTFIEWERGKPYGPVANHLLGLGDDGTWFRHSDGGVWWGGGPVRLSQPPPDNFVQGYGNVIAKLVLPALLTISFLHCKNVTVSQVTPPEKLSQKYRRRHGMGLTRYHVLEIRPLKRVLEAHRIGSGGSFRAALHICRGHFKTFTPDAPLLGRHTGTYWWAAQVRGSKEEGVVLKDYRVAAPSEVGRTYQSANESPAEAAREPAPGREPDSAGRGLAAHNRTQNQIAEIVRELGLAPLSPKPGEPEYDLAWKAGGTLFVCEVKSLTPEIEERQLRTAVGQVIRYRQRLNAAGHEPARAVIATEQAPVDKSWGALCTDENILLVWPENAKDRLMEAEHPVNDIRG